MITTPACWIIAGPNGAGETTFALDYLPAVAHCQTFINADLIAAGLSPLNPEREQLAASRLCICRKSTGASVYAGISPLRQLCLGAAICGWWIA